MKILPLNDIRWGKYRSGYNRVVLDTPAWIKKLISGSSSNNHWDYLWNELHHQSDVGEASYAVVPYLAQYAQKFKTQEWHIWGFPVVVELARLDTENPEIPEEIKEGYFEAFNILAEIAIEHQVWDEEVSGCMSACIALSKKQPVFARAYLEMAGKETALDFLKEETGWELGD